MEVFKKPIIKDIVTNLTYLILVVIYVISFNSQGKLLGIAYINISSIIFLGISIIMFEVGYRTKHTKTFINGIEFFVFAILTLFIKHIPKTLGNTVESYTEIIAYGFLAYYTLKLATIYTIMKQNQLKSMSDIKEIVKEEPTKKETKRKNKKEKEGK